MILAVFLWGTAHGASAGMPARVVSMNLCTDQLLLQLADPLQIVSLSYLSRNPDMSVLHAKAREFPANHGRAEEIYLLHPDLVLADTWSSPETIRMLRRLGIRVEQLPTGITLDQIRGRIARMGDLLGHPDRATKLLAQFDEGLAHIRKPAPGLRVAIYGTGGYGYGPKTLEGQILGMAGLSNVISGKGLDYGGPMPLEQLVMDHPDLVIAAGTPGGRGTSRAQQVLRHPVLRELNLVTGLRDARWSCAGPAILGAVEALAHLGREIGKDRLSR